LGKGQVQRVRRLDAERLVEEAVGRVAEHQEHHHLPVVPADRLKGDQHEHQERHAHGFVKLRREESHGARHECQRVRLGLPR